MQASVLGPQSVDGVRGGSLVHGSCTISPRLTRGCQVSGDGREDARVLHIVIIMQLYLITTRQQPLFYGQYTGQLLLAGTSS